MLTVLIRRRLIILWITVLIKDESIAFLLAGKREGRAILRADESFRLAKLINQNAMNHVIEEGLYGGQSVAYCLAGKREGRAILQADDFRLAKLINENCLNHVIEKGLYKGLPTCKYPATIITCYLRRARKPIRAPLASARGFFLFTQMTNLSFS